MWRHNNVRETGLFSSGPFHVSGSVFCLSQLISLATILSFSKAYSDEIPLSLEAQRQLNDVDAAVQQILEDMIRYEPLLNGPAGEQEKPSSDFVNFRTVVAKFSEDVELSRDGESFRVSQASEAEGGIAEMVISFPAGTSSVCIELSGIFQNVVLPDDKKFIYLGKSHLLETDIQKRGMRLFPGDDSGFMKSIVVEIPEGMSAGRIRFTIVAPGVRVDAGAVAIKVTLN